MTAEIVIMNKQAIALASDSAVTMTHEMGEKIKTSANKLFALSKYHPVGVMIYNNADLMGIPWETIIKIYRNKIDKKASDSLKEYADNFIAFLDNGNPLFSDSVQKEYLYFSVYGYFDFIKEQIFEYLEFFLSEKPKITQDEIKKIISKIIKEHYEKWKNANSIPSIPDSHINEIKEKYGETIEKVIYEVFQELPISKIHSDQLKEIGASLFSKFPDSIWTQNLSGIIFAGFGEKEIFPSIKAYDIEGIVNNKLKYRESLTDEIGHKTDASIIPFAQREMVDTFMQGIDPSYRNLEESYLKKIFNEFTDISLNLLKTEKNDNNQKSKKILQKSSEKIILDFQKKLENHRQEMYIDPVLSVVSMLSKDELAAMAETLVNLTSFKRKITMGSETVGGPIDVAVISKGDGFIWIKRKHYFKPELNPQFFANYYKEEIKDDKEGKN
jgi:hypothetical protein